MTTTARTRTRTGHMPGPWHLQWPSEDSDAIDPVIVGPDDVEPIAYVKESGSAIHGEDAISTANARLIASAPELLEALTTAPPCPGTPGHFPINSRDLHDWFTRYWNWQQEREAAIALVEGRKSQ